ncbi:MAG: hypothetical protein AAFX39_06740 [Pseudomonadota bacterium]
MPPLLALAAIGAGTLIGLRLLDRAQKQVASRVRASEQKPIDLKPDPKTGIYRPDRRDDAGAA